MYSYLAFLHSGVEAYTGRAHEDGKRLARHCIEKLNELGDSGQFPPRLLILLASPAYLETFKASNLVNGVNQTFADEGFSNVPLIGCTTGAVFFNRRVHRDGALLICLASRLLRAKIAVGKSAFADPEGAVNNLLRDLELHSDQSENPNPFGNRFLLTFLPGFHQKKYEASTLHHLLRENLIARIPIFGGGATAASTEHVKPGLLFANREVYRDAVVAARVMCGTPVSVSLSHGLTVADPLLRVSRFDKEKNEIISFYERTNVAEVVNDLEERNGIALLAESAVNRHPVIENPHLTENGQAIRLTRNIREDTAYRAMRANPEKILMEVQESVKRASKTVRAENPIACLAFKCNGLLFNREKINLDFEREFAVVEESLGNHRNGDYVGAFVEGEAGVDRDGRSLLRNWSTATMVFGDELSDRTLFVRGFSKLANLARDPLSEPKGAMKKLLEMLCETGFPGAMLSSWLPDQNQERIVGRVAVGARYPKIVDQSCPLAYDKKLDALALAAHDRMPRFIPDSRKSESHCDLKLVEQSGIISQYIIPLMNLQGKVGHLLQIDLGDVSYKSEPHLVEREALDSLGVMFASILNHVFSGEESRIILDLDQALKECLSANTVQEGLQRFIELALKAFGLELGHIRIAHEERYKLGLVAGKGKAYDIFRKTRPEIEFGDASRGARAFREGALSADEILPAIINDAKADRFHQLFSERIEREIESSDGTKEDQLELREVMNSIGSFASIYFRSQNGTRGVIGLFCEQAWFFGWCHVNALKALSDRVGHLINHLHQKQSRELLRSVNYRLLDPQYHKVSPKELLELAIKRFASSMKAEFASLFIWDKDRELQILRAQDGWHDPEWVDAAYYGKTGTWLGSSTLAGLPRYVPNLYEFYVAQGYEEHGSYNKHIFGKEISSDFTVEAIGLPLSIDGAQIGVVALYREIHEGQPSGFLTSDDDLLQEWADQLASLVKHIELKRQIQWDEEEVRRQREVLTACGSKDGGEPFEIRICRQAVKTYNLDSADLYSVRSVRRYAEESGNLTPEIVWKAGVLHTGEVRSVSPTLPLDEIVKRTAMDSRNIDKDAHVRRRVPENDQPLTRERASIYGSIDRVCMPLLIRDELIGILDLKLPPECVTYRFSKVHLQLFGQAIGAAYSQNQNIEKLKKGEQARREIEEKQKLDEMMRGEFDERSELAVKATGAYAFQALHRLMNVIQRITNQLAMVSASRNEAEREARIREIDEALRKASDILDLVKGIGKRVAYPRSDNCCLADLIRQALAEIDIDESIATNIDWKSLEKVVVNVDPKHTKEIFINLINNAVEAMREKERRELSIIHTPNQNAVTSAATVVIKDTGKGMTDEQIKTAMKGFVSTRTRRGVGVLISRALLNAQGGTLKYNSNVNFGTETIVTLPLTQIEASI